MDDLCPCPFCRGPATMSLPDISAGGTAVVCSQCGAHGPRAWESAEAVAGWNKRAEAETARADLNALLDALNSDTVEGALEWADQLWVWVDEWNKVGQPKPSAYQSVDKYGRVYTWTLLPKKP